LSYSVVSDHRLDDVGLNLLGLCLSSYLYSLDEGSSFQLHVC